MSLHHSVSLHSQTTTHVPHTSTVLTAAWSHFPSQVLDTNCPGEGGDDHNTIAIPDYHRFTGYHSQGHPILCVIAMGKSSRRGVIRLPREVGEKSFFGDASKVRADAVGAL